MHPFKADDPILIPFCCNKRYTISILFLFAANLNAVILKYLKLKLYFKKKLDWNFMKYFYILKLYFILKTKMSFQHINKFFDEIK